ncbi:MAG: TolC family protein [Bryobacteraceae bacterium]|jgi:outer membrane protein TolC
MTYIPQSPFHVRHLVWLLASWAWAASAQPSNITILPPRPRPLGFLTRAYQQRAVPPVNLNNSGRLSTLIRADSLYLSARDVVALAIENNIDIEIQRYGPLMARQDIDRARVGGALRAPSTAIAPGPQSVSLAGINVSNTSLATGAGVGSGGGITGQIGSLIPQTDPMLNLSANFGHYTSPQSNLVLYQSNSIVEDVQDFSAGYSQQFMNGAAFNINYGSQRATVNVPTVLLNPLTQGSLNLNISQNLLQGFGASVNNRYIRIARNNSRYSVLQLKQQVTTTVSAALNLYWDLVAFNEDLRLKRLALDAARQLYEDNKKELAAGAIAAIEVTRAQAEIPAREEDVLIAQTNLLQQEIVLKNALSRTGMEDPALENAHIVTLDPIQVPEQEGLAPLKDLVKQALEQRPDLEQNRINIQSQLLVLRGDRSELKPSLQAFASFTNQAQVGAPNPLNTGDQFGAPDPYYIAGYGSLLAQIFRRNFPNYTLGFSLTVPIRNRAAQADFATDQLQMRQQELQLEKSVAQVSVDVRNALIGVEQAHSRYETALETLKLARETLAAEKKKYEFGKSTNALVIQAQRDVVAAESEQVQSMANYTHARIALDQAVGMTLERNDISMAEAVSGQVDRRSSLPATLPGEK